MLDCKTSLKSWQRPGSTFPEAGSTETSFPQILVYLRLKVWETQVAHICIYSYIHIITAARDSHQRKVVLLWSGVWRDTEMPRSQGREPRVLSLWHFHPAAQESFIATLPDNIDVIAWNPGCPSPGSWGLLGTSKICPFMCTNWSVNCSLIKNMRLELHRNVST